MPVRNLPPRDESVLVVIDIQERLAQAMPPTYLQGHIRRAAKLCHAAGELGVPVLLTEQYPQGLGPTLPVIEQALPEGTRRFTKTAFSCLGCTPFGTALAATERRRVVIVGMETHVCVAQTALDLAAEGYMVDVVADAVLSRYGDDYHTALAYLRTQGMGVVTFEMVLFAWLRDASDPAFRKLSGLARDRDF